MNSILNEKLFSKLVVFILCCLLSSYAQAFSDVGKNHPIYNASKYLEEHSIIKGFSDNTFRPTAKLTRAEAIKILLTAKKIPVKNFTQSDFVDVNEKDWHFNYINTALESKLITLNTEKKFYPNRTINRAEFLKLLLETFKIKFENYTPPATALYSDLTDNSQWFIKYFDFSKSLNLIPPDQYSKIYPGNQVTRGEASEILYKFLKIYYEQNSNLTLAKAEGKLVQSILDLQAGHQDNALKNFIESQKLTSQIIPDPQFESYFKAIKTLQHSQEILIDTFQRSDGNQFETISNLLLENCQKAFQQAEFAEKTNSETLPIAELIKKLSQNQAEKIRGEL